MKKLQWIIVAIIIGGGLIWWNSSRAPESALEASPLPTTSPLVSDQEAPVPTASPSATPVESAKAVAKPAPQVRNIVVEGRNFAFSQERIEVQRGDTVRITLQSVEGFHDWTLEGYGVATDSISAGSESVVEFVADTAGSFEYYCSVGSHRQFGMVGTLVVSE